MTMNCNRIRIIVKDSPEKYIALLTLETLEWPRLSPYPYACRYQEVWILKRLRQTLLAYVIVFLQTDIRMLLLKVTVKVDDC